MVTGATYLPERERKKSTNNHWQASCLFQILNLRLIVDPGTARLCLLRLQISVWRYDYELQQRGVAGSIYRVWWANHIDPGMTAVCMSDWAIMELEILWFLKPLERIKYFPCSIFIHIFHDKRLTQSAWAFSFEIKLFICNCCAISWVIELNESPMKIKPTGIPSIERMIHCSQTIIYFQRRYNNYSWKSLCGAIETLPQHRIHLVNVLIYFNFVYSRVLFLF